MLKEFLEKCLALAEPKELVMLGRTYTTATVHAVTEPIPSVVKIQSLTGLKDLIEGGLNKLNRAVCFLLVSNHKTVTLSSTHIDIWAKRIDHATTEAVLADSFAFGRYLDKDEFIVGLHSRFVVTPEQEALLELVSALTAEAVTTSSDDGISQQVATRKGVALKQGQIVKPRHKLAPYRTFAEIEQPASEFVLRFKQERDGAIPSIALFEADGGAWKIEAMQRIKAWLSTNIPGITVVA